MNQENEIRGVSLKKFRWQKNSEELSSQIIECLPEFLGIAKLHSEEFISAQDGFELRDNDKYLSSLIPSNEHSYPNVQTLINLLKKEVDLENRYSNFFNSLGSGSYYNGSVVITKK